MTDRERTPPSHDTEERIDPGGASGEPGAGLGAPADAPGFEDAVPRQKLDDRLADPPPAEGEDTAQPSPADGGD